MFSQKKNKISMIKIAADSKLGSRQNSTENHEKEYFCCWQSVLKEEEKDRLSAVLLLSTPYMEYVESFRLNNNIFKLDIQR